MSAAKFAFGVVLPLASFWLQGCDVQGTVQNFIDTHAEAVCEQLEAKAAGAVMEGFLAEADAKCALDPAPEICKNCASNGLTQTKDGESKQFIEQCAQAAKNVFNDTGAVETWANSTAPSYYASLNASMQAVVADPNAYCEGAGTGVTRLFQMVPRIARGPQGRKNALVLGFATLGFVSSVVFVVVRRSRRSIYAPSGDMEDALHDGTVDIE